MAGPILQVCGAGARWCAAAVWSLLVWTLWLALALVLAAQVYIARTNELRVPFFVQRDLEARLAVSGIHVSFGHASFDPSGRILAEDVRVRLPGFEETMVTARAIYVRLDPWALLLRRFEPVELRVTGASFRVPALLSPSGKADEVVRDLDGAFLPRGGDLTVEYLNCHVGNLAVSLHGGLHLGDFRGRREAPLPLAEFLARHYGTVSGECAAALDRLALLERPMLRVRLTPSGATGASVRAVLQTEGLKLKSAGGLEISGLRIAARWPETDGAPAAPTLIAGTALALTVEADTVRLPAAGTTAERVRAWLEADLAAPSGPGLASVAPREVRAVAAAISGRDWTLQAPVLTVGGLGWLGAKAGSAPRTLDAALRAWLWSQPVSAHAGIDLDGRAADVDFQGAVGLEAVAFISGKLKRDLRLWADFTAPIRLAGQVRFGPGWRFARVAARVRAEDITAKHVHLDDVGGLIEFDGRHLQAPELSAHMGEDFVRGSFTEDVPSREYRFLLHGRLRPLDIAPWIAGAWWPVFFGNFAFPDGPPATDVDLRGAWGTGRKAAVFVAFDTAGMILRGVPVDRLRTRLFIRPNFIDGLEVALRRGPASVSGTFARRIELGSGAWQSLDLDLVSTLDLDTVKKIMGPSSPSVLSLFVSEQPPTVALRGHLDGPASPSGAHQALHIEAHAPGAFRYSDFPLSGADFTADVRDDDITLGSIAAGLAGGRVTGRARIRTRAGQRRLEFDGALHAASLGQAAETINAFTARRAGQPVPPPGSFVRDRAGVRLDIEAAAEGDFSDLLSYQGAGTARLQGAGLGEVRILGPLSALLPIMSLRFTAARGTFKIDGAQLVFSHVAVTGANSGIVAHGTYALDKHTLDFRATVNPFQESKSLPQRVMDVMLTPLADVLSVKLTGTIDKPAWAFANGPTSFFRSLGSSPTPAPAPAPSPLKAP